MPPPSFNPINLTISQLSIFLDFLQVLYPPREATVTLIGISQTLEKSVREIVTDVVSLSNKNYRPLGIMPVGQDFDTLVGHFSKALVKYVSIVKADLKVSFSLSFSHFFRFNCFSFSLSSPFDPAARACQGEYSEAAVEVVQAVAKIHSYIQQSDVPDEVLDIEMYQINREIIMNGVISQTKTYAAASKSAASLWPPPKANESAIDTASSFFRTVCLVFLPLESN